MTVPEITQLPELSTGVEDPEAFADMVLTATLRYDIVVLSTEYPWDGHEDAGASWRVHSKDLGITLREFETGISPSFSSYEQSLCYLRDRYFGCSGDHGVAEFTLSQRDRDWNCHAFYSMCERTGHWLRLYAHG